MYLVEVYVTNASLNINYPFTYYSDEVVEKFVRVNVHFGKGYTNAIVSNCIYTDKSKKQIEAENGYKLLPILKVLLKRPRIRHWLFLKK